MALNLVGMNTVGPTSSHGFIAVEAILAVVLVAAVGFGASQLLLRTAQQTSGVENAQKAMNLAKMVFEQYGSYASSNFASLSLYQLTHATPKEFFHAADNMSFDRMDITSTVTYSENKTTCTVNVAISWAQGGTPEVSHFSRKYSASLTILGGVSAQVYVKVPCGSYTLPADIVAHCPGVAGVQVSGQSVKGNATAGITDANGLVILNQLLSSDQNLFTFKSPSASDYTVLPSSPGFMPLYYGQDSNGNYVTAVNVPVVILSGVVNSVLFSSFTKAGVLKGSIINDSDPGTMPAGLSVTLQNAVAPLNGSVIVSTNSLTTFVDGNGNYSFGNIILLNNSLLNIIAIAGSSWNVQPGPSFQWGYTAFPSTYPISASAYISVQGTPTIVQPNVHIKKAGWILLQTVDKADLVTPIPNVSMSAVFPPGQGYPATPFTFNTGADGRFTLYNIVTQTPVAINFTGTIPGMHAEIGSNLTSTALGSGTDVVVPMSQTYRLIGSISDSGPNSAIRLGQMTAHSENIAGTYNRTAPVSSTGSFVLDNLYMDPLTSDVTQPFKIRLRAYGSFNPPFTGDYVGTAIDQLTGQPAPHAGLRSDTLTFYSDATGHFDSGVSTLVWNSGWAHPNVVCQTAPQFVCHFSDGPFPVNSSVCLGVGYGLNSQLGYHIVGVDPTLGNWIAMVNDNAASNPFTVNFRLVEYSLHGTLKDAATGTPLPGITLLDANSGLRATTAADGSYTLWLVIQNRTLSADGTVTLKVLPQSANGLNYNAATFTFPIPHSPNPGISIPADLTLDPILVSSV